MNTVRISWGIKIAILYISFVILMLVLVMGSIKQDFHLVSKDYYQQELDYQDIIDAGKNRAALSSPLHISAEAAAVVIDFPSEFNAVPIKGTIQFYSQVNAAWDKQFPVDGPCNRFSISRNELHNTLYLVKIRWRAANKDYYQESTINLNQ